MILDAVRYELRHLANRRARTGVAYGGRTAALLDDAGFAEVWAEVPTWPDYAPTPLHDLPGLARQAGIGRIAYKDEGGRFGLGAFKCLGGGYAVFRLLAREVERRTGRRPTSGELMDGDHREMTERTTVACATAGNHGKGVAWGAWLFGCRAVIYVSEHVKAPRVHALAALDAEVVRVPGHYEAALAQAAADAARHGWVLVTDTAGADWGPIQIDILQGYRVLAEEAVAQLGDAVPSHVFVQGGVGGLAAGLLAHLWRRYGARRPRFVVVEPASANALMLSAAAGRPSVLAGEIETVMGCLAAAEVHHVAWEILADCADDFLAIDDVAALELMRRLAEPATGDPAIAAGESGVAGLAGLWAAVHDGAVRTALGLDPSSHVLVIGSEGANDPESYRRIVGKPPEAVRPT